MTTAISVLLPLTTPLSITTEVVELVAPMVSGGAYPEYARFAVAPELTDSAEESCEEFVRDRLNQQTDRVR